jgi:hypothetical protein
MRCALHSGASQRSLTYGPCTKPPRDISGRKRQELAVADLARIKLAFRMRSERPPLRAVESFAEPQHCDQ